MEACMQLYGSDCHFMQPGDLPGWYQHAFEASAGLCPPGFDVTGSRLIKTDQVLRVTSSYTESRKSWNVLECLGRAKCRGSGSRQCITAEGGFSGSSLAGQCHDAMPVLVSGSWRKPPSAIGPLGKG